MLRVGPHEAILEPDRLVPESDRFAFYHVNPTEKLSSKLAYEMIGPGEYYGRFYDPHIEFNCGGGVYGNGRGFDDIIVMMRPKRSTIFRLQCILFDVARAIRGCSRSAKPVPMRKPACVERGNRIRCGG